MKFKILFRYHSDPVSYADSPARLPGHYEKQRKVRSVGLFLFFNPSTPKSLGALACSGHTTTIYAILVASFNEIYVRQLPSAEIINVPVLRDDMLLQNLLITARIKCTCRHVLAVCRTYSFSMSSQDDKGTLTIKYHQKGNKP